MVRYLIEDVKAGMIVGKSVFDENQRLIIAKGFRLKAEHITLLKTKNIASLFIDEEGTENAVPKTVISKQVKNELAATIKNFSKEVGNILDKSKQNNENIKKVIKQDKNYIKTIIRNSGAERVINRVIEDILREPWSVINLEKIRDHSDEFYNYVLNVTIISLCIGHKFRFTHEELKQLGMGVINYDIGMLAVPEKILNKDTDITAQERSILMQHTIYGYLMLLGIQTIPATSSNIALCHHEYQDGSGFPKGLKGENRPPIKSKRRKGSIDRFAEIVTVADTYDMLTNGRKHFCQKMEPEKAIQKMIDMRKTKLNIEILKTFISIIPIYPVGTRIRVTDSPRSELMGCYGVVAFVRPGHLFEPVIILVESKLQKRLPKTMKVDFSKHKGFGIELA